MSFFFFPPFFTGIVNYRKTGCTWSPSFFSHFFFSIILSLTISWYHTGGHSELASEWGNPLWMFDKSKASKVWLRDFTTGEVLPIYMHTFPAQTTDITRVYQGDVLS